MPQINIPHKGKDPGNITVEWSWIAAGGALLSNNNKEVLMPGDRTARAYTPNSISSGKWYWELVSLDARQQAVGVAIATTSWSEVYGVIRNDGLNQVSNAVGWCWTGAQSYQDLFWWAPGSVIGFAIDKDLNVLSVYHNGIFIGTHPITLPTSPVFIMVADSGQPDSLENDLLLDNNPGYEFQYPIPAGYTALNLLI